MEHLQLLLRFISGPEIVENQISQVEDPALPIPNGLASGVFVPKVGFSEMKGKPNSPVVNWDIPSSVLPLEAEPHFSEPSPIYDLSVPRLFRRGHHNNGGIREDFLPSTLQLGMDGLVKNESKVKDESFNSTIFQNHDDRSTRYFYSPTYATMKAESLVFGNYNGSIGHWRKPITVGKNTSLALQSTAKNLLITKPRESSKVPKNDVLSSLDFIKRVCTRKIAKASKQHTCQTCKKKFKQKCHLYRHQRQHSGVKRFFCIHCSRGFYQRSNLQAHSRTHSNDGSISHRYACTFCTKRFTRNSSLMKHMEKHSDGLIKMK